jgi:hypothetical protein
LLEIPTKNYEKPLIESSFGTIMIGRDRINRQIDYAILIEYYFKKNQFANRELGGFNIQF